MKVTIEIKKANTITHQIKRSDGTFMYIKSDSKKGKKLIDFLKGQ
jgi:hypothetical protein|tara:strand:+ start:413 stop:547 length:135 start_codon:yes stop_codon:yes gene_type:complete